MSKPTEAMQRKIDLVLKVVNTDDKVNREEWKAGAPASTMTAAQACRNIRTMLNALNVHKNRCAGREDRVWCEVARLGQ